MSITLDRTTRPLASVHHNPRRLSIAMLAPPWIAVPPTGYGGVETVVADLTEALVDRGHDVTLFCAPGSHSSATTVTLLDEQHPSEIERSLYEADHVARAFAAIDAASREGSGFDIVHDHCGFTALAMADRLETPLLHTLHGPFTRDVLRAPRRQGLGRRDQRRAAGHGPREPAQRRRDPQSDRRRLLAVSALR